MHEFKLGDLVLIESDDKTEYQGTPKYGEITTYIPGGFVDVTVLHPHGVEVVPNIATEDLTLRYGSPSHAHTDIKDTM